MLSDEERADDDERLHGTLTIAPLDGVHWVDAAGGRRLRLAVRAGAVGVGTPSGPTPRSAARARLFSSASENDEPDALLAGTRDLRAARGNPARARAPVFLSVRRDRLRGARRRGRHRAAWQSLVELRDDGVARGAGGEPLPGLGAQAGRARRPSRSPRSVWRRWSMRVGYQRLRAR